MNEPTAAQLPDDHVLLRTLAGGICGSDAPKFQGLKPPGRDSGNPRWPGPPGFPLHEIVGEIVATTTDDLGVGQRVVGWAHESDGLAELVVTASMDVAPYDPSLSPIDAVLLQPLACVMEAIDRIEVRGRVVAILGMGAIGAMFAHIAREWGAGHVLGVDPIDRAELVERGVVDETLMSTAAEWVATLGRSGRPDVVIEAVGHQTDTVSNALNACGEAGTILCFGIPDDDVYPINMELVMRKNLTIMGGITRNRRKALQAATAYLEAHRDLVDTIITHRFDRYAVGEAYEVALLPQSGRLKVVVDLAP